MILEIVKFPNPILTTPCKPVTEFNTVFLKALVQDMFETMYDAPGAGLAANQVGQSLSLFVFDVGYKREKIFVPAENGVENAKVQEMVEQVQITNANPQVFINPKIVKAWGEMDGEEGCLSIPGASAELKRALHLQVEYQDMMGEKHLITVGGEGHELLSRCIQHEMDHLAGKLYIQHLSPMKREMALKKWKTRR